MRSLILTGLLLLALTGCIGSPKKAPAPAPVKTSHSTPAQSARSGSPAQKGSSTNALKSAQSAAAPARTNTAAAASSAAAESAAPIRTPPSHAAAEMSVPDSTRVAVATPVDRPATAPAPTPTPPPAPAPAQTAMIAPTAVPATTPPPQVGPGVDRYPVLDAAFHYLFAKLSSSGSEKKTTAAYLLQQGELTPRLVASLVGNEPEVEEYRLPKGFDLDTYRQGTGLSIKVWSAQVLELAQDRALVKLSWRSGKSTAGAYVLTLERSNGKWQVVKEQAE